MASTDRNTDRRRTHAERRAAAEAAARAEAERRAKERRQQTIIGAVVIGIVVVLLAIAGFAIWNSFHQKAEQARRNDISLAQARKDLADVKVKPKRADAEGGILISDQGYGKRAEGAPTVAIYMDFMCPGCGNLNRTLDPTLIEMMDAGQLNLELHPMAFGDVWSADEYSTRAANMMLYISDHDDDPDHLLEFISKLYEEDFQPGENSGKLTSDEQLVQRALDAGVAKDVAKDSVTRRYTPWLKAVDTYTPMLSKLWNTSGQYKGQMTTPTVTINDVRWDTSEVSQAGLDLRSGFLQAVGIKEDKVGAKGTMPSIGDKGKPISAMTGKPSDQ